MIRSFRHKGLAEFFEAAGKPLRHSIRVNGPWRITFEWIDGDAWRVDLEQYH